MTKTAPRKATAGEPAARPWIAIVVATIAAVGAIAAAIVASGPSPSAPTSANASGGSVAIAGAASSNAVTVTNNNPLANGGREEADSGIDSGDSDSGLDGAAP